MRIETRVGEGTSVKVYLPRVAENFNSEVAAVTVVNVQSKRKGLVILIVDDDSAVREVTGSILEDLGYVVLKSGSGGAALDLLDQQSNVDLVLLDFAMPGMSGVEVARQIKSKYPAIPILFVTGYADKNALRDVGDERIIKKPFIGEELAEKSNRARQRNFAPKRKSRRASSALTIRRSMSALPPRSELGSEASARPLWVISCRPTMALACPLYPRKLPRQSRVCGLGHGPRDRHSSLKTAFFWKLFLRGWVWICSHVENVTRYMQYTAKNSRQRCRRGANHVTQSFHRQNLGIG